MSSPVQHPPLRFEEILRCSDAFVFFNETLIVQEDVKHSGEETRFHALGTTDEGRLLHVTFALRGSARLVRVISARDMHRKERDQYAQET